MTPDWLDDQGDQIMDLGRHPYHDGFLGITAVYHSRYQEMDLQVAASPDGRPMTWWRPARRPCLPLAPLGEYGGGLIWPTRTLVEDGDEWVLFYGATEGLHGDPYARDESVLLFHGAFCRASWRKGRMWAAVPAAGGAQEGSLTTVPAGTVRGRQLIVNVVTKRGGQLVGELLRDGKPVAGYGRADCVPVSGDETCAVVRWRGATRCPADGVALRLYLRSAYLYGSRGRRTPEQPTSLPVEPVQPDAGEAYSVQRVEVHQRNPVVVDPGDAGITVVAVTPRRIRRHAAKPIPGVSSVC